MPFLGVSVFSIQRDARFEQLVNSKIPERVNLPQTQHCTTCNATTTRSPRSFTYPSRGGLTVGSRAPKRGERSREALGRSRRTERQGSVWVIIKKKKKTKSQTPEISGALHCTPETTTSEPGSPLWDRRVVPERVREKQWARAQESEGQRERDGDRKPD